MKNIIVLITGGLGDIGFATSAYFGKKGCRIAIADQISPDQAEPKLQQLQQQGCHQVFYQQVDVTSEEAVSNWLKVVQNRWGVPQIIIPNAGIVVAGALTSDELQATDIEKQIAVNFWGAYYVSVHASRLLKKMQLPGRITFIGSWTAERPTVRIGAYCISKAAVRMLSRTLALELAEYNILVNEVAPGIVSGGLSQANQEKDGQLRQRHLEAIPVHRLIPLEEVVRQIWQLSDLNNTSITGSTILMDGGLSLTSKMTP
ncbi:SDR family oxidoreductase [Gramella sp. AN32]|uniref:SDR family NAD(P)-dependent oxidoreductase n=1 Tax=Christiangramia antarctica TaxID=2058158 RepID=A0ABW5X3Y1_9FLAO|nr:SDR family oxidoreductase [Gramella sp. AN32]MCM4155763.1 2-deoxy-D-gluconate 3-dehydrogenase [Gramella sp. AN32]